MVPLDKLLSRALQLLRTIIIYQYLPIYALRIA